MKIQDIFTADELALIDSGNYKPGRAALDAKLDLAMAIEREAIIQEIPGGYSVDPQWVCDMIRARGQA
jgi:hypothetical protein